MKNLRIAFALFCTTILPFNGGELFAQMPGNVRFIESEECPAPAKAATMNVDNSGQNNVVRIGYCNNRRSGALSPADGEPPYEYGGMVRFDKKLLSKYIGCSLDSVSFRLSSVAGSSIAVFVTYDYSNQSNYLTSKVVYEYEEGWNNVKLPKSIKITGEKDIYVGYVINVTESGENVGITFDSGTTFVPGCNFYGSTTQEGPIGWYSADPIGYNVSLRAFASGENIPATDAGAFALSIYDLMDQGAESIASFNLRNYGSETITDIDVELQCDGKVIGNNTIKYLEVPSNEEVSIEVEDFKFDDDGNHKYSLSVTKINGKDDSDMSDNYTERDIFVINKNAVEQPRNALVEIFASEYVRATPDIDEIYNAALNNYPEAIAVRHHITFQRRNDQLVKEGDDIYNRYFDLTPDGPFIPAVMVDRTMFVGMPDPGPTYFADSDYALSALIEASLTFPSYITVTPAVKLSDDKTTLNVNIEGLAQMDEMPFQKALRLNVYLVEDKVGSTSLLDYNGTYYHDGIIRAELGATEGLDLDISELSFSKDFQVELIPEWNLENMRVVAFVCSYSKEDCSYNTVYNVNQVLLSDLSGGVENIAIENSAPHVWYDGEKVRTDANASIVSVCGINGAAVQTTGLSSGFYIVTVEVGTTRYSQKLIVR